MKFESAIVVSNIWIAAGLGFHNSDWLAFGFLWLVYAMIRCLR